jgi:hypothetical protein
MTQHLHFPGALKRVTSLAEVSLKDLNPLPVARASSSCRSLTATNAFVIRSSQVSKTPPHSPAWSHP